MASIITGLISAIGKTIIDILYMPGPEKDCEEGYAKVSIKSSDGKTDTNICQAKMPSPFIAVKASDKQGYSGNATAVWNKPGYPAYDQTIATGKNCPVSTFPFDGKCNHACPKNFIRQLVEGTGTGTGKPAEYRCVAECNGKWHVMDWIFPGNEAMQTTFGQNTDGKPYNDICYHPLPAPEEADPNKDLQVREYLKTPFNLRVIMTSPSWRKGDAAGLLADGTPIGSGRRFEAAGAYAQRTTFPLGPAMTPTPCLAPNLVTASQRCVRPCPAPYYLIGDDCVQTDVVCPAKFSKASSDGTYCIPNTKEVPRYPSILVFIGILLSFLTGGVIVAKIIRARTPVRLS